MYLLIRGWSRLRSPQDIFEPGEEPLTDNQREVLVGPRSIIILVGK